jgi:hypothetical protein
MSQQRDLCFQPRLRLERRDHDMEEQDQEPDHCASAQDASRDRRHAERDLDQGARRARGADGGTQAEAANHIARETGIWKKVIADAGIRLE